MQQLFIVRSKSKLSTYFYEIMSKQHSFLKAFFTMCFTQFRFNLLCSSLSCVFPVKIEWFSSLKGKKKGKIEGGSARLISSPLAVPEPKKINKGNKLVLCFIFIFYFLQYLECDLSLSEKPSSPKEIRTSDKPPISYQPQK